MEYYVTYNTERLWHKLIALLLHHTLRVYWLLFADNHIQNPGSHTQMLSEIAVSATDYFHISIGLC